MTHAPVPHVDFHVHTAQIKLSDLLETTLSRKLCMFSRLCPDTDSSSHPVCSSFYFMLRDILRINREVATFNRRTHHLKFYVEWAVEGTQKTHTLRINTDYIEVDPHIYTHIQSSHPSCRTPHNYSCK